ncbi:hypothetical protein Tco_1062648 [Tanacetum coccineum]
MDQDSAHMVAASKVPMLKPEGIITEMPITTAEEKAHGRLEVKARITLMIGIPKWSATTATRGDILLGSAKLQEIKTTRTRKAQEGVCLWKHLLPQL